MRVAVSIDNPGAGAQVSPRFGRSGGFILFDVEAGSPSVRPAAEMSEIGSSLGSGAGIATAQSLSDAGVDAVVAGNFGPNAASVLRSAGIRMYVADQMAAADAVKALLGGTLSEVTGPTTPSHSGMRRF